MALSGNRIAVLRANGEALVKEGGLSAGWTTEHTQVKQVALSGNRIAVLRANGEALVKEGGLSEGWITVHTQVPAGGAVRQSHRGPDGPTARRSSKRVACRQAGSPSTPRSPRWRCPAIASQS